MNCLGCGSHKFPIKRDIKHRGPEGKLYNKPIMKTTFFEKSEISIDEDYFPVDQSLQSKVTRSNKRIGNTTSLRPQSAKLKLK